MCIRDRIHPGADPAEQDQKPAISHAEGIEGVPRETEQESKIGRNTGGQGESRHLVRFQMQFVFQNELQRQPDQPGPSRSAKAQQQQQGDEIEEDTALLGRGLSLIHI